MTPQDRLSLSLEALSLKLDVPIQASLLQLLEILLRENEKINLTAIKTMDDGVTKHLIDSLAPLTLPWLSQIPAQHIVDLGSGSGMPALALALVRPDWVFTLVESTKKKAHFLDMASAELGLIKRIRVQAERAETLGQGSLREKADLVTCRALGRLAIVLELALPLLKVGGRLIAYKGPKPNEEMSQASKALKVLGAKVIELKEFTLPLSEEGRSLIVVEKVSATARMYPRSPGTPAKEPLQ